MESLAIHMQALSCYNSPLGYDTTVCQKGLQAVYYCIAQTAEEFDFELDRP